MKRGGKTREKEKFSEGETTLKYSNQVVRTHKNDLILEEKAWAQLYDYCHAQDRHYFVLTTVGSCDGKVH